MSHEFTCMQLRQGCSNIRSWPLFWAPSKFICHLITINSPSSDRFYLINLPLRRIFSHMKIIKSRTQSHPMQERLKYRIIKPLLVSYSSVCSIMFFFCAATPSGPVPPRSQGFYITYNDASQSVGLLWTSDQIVAECSIM